MEQNEKKFIFIEKMVYSFIDILMSPLNSVYEFFMNKYFSKQKETNIEKNNLQKRLISGFVMAFLIIIFIAVGSYLYYGLLLLMALLTMKEFEDIIKTTKNEEYKRFKSLSIFYSFIPTFSFILIREQEQGFYITIWLFAVIATIDTGAYFVGKKIGKISILPTISPKKTVEGAISGTLSALLTSFILYFAFSSSKPAMSLFAFFVFSLIAIVLAQVGDAAESIIKRKFSVKESGNIIPGHGGIMDRMDSFIFSAFFVAIIVLINRGKLF